MRFTKLFFITVFAVGIFAFTPRARAADTYCFCYDDLGQITSENYKQFDSGEKVLSTSDCVIKPTLPQGGPAQDCREVTKRAGHYFDKCDQPYDNLFKCQEAIQRWHKNWEKIIQDAKSTNQAVGGLQGRAIPSCLLKDQFDPSCRDVGIFIELFINWARSSFAIVGAFALAYFIYGGFILILSQGNPEKIKKGTDTMLAAIIGMFVMFVGYMAIRFLSQAVGVKEQFRLK